MTLLTRVLAVLGTLAAAMPALAPAARAADDWRHGSALMGDVKYPAGFKQFDYVNPDAPKGGIVRFGATGTFDSFNAFIIQGNPAAGITSVYDTLATSSFDEPATDYGLIAEAMKYPPDYSSVTYKLRKEARWQDGKPLTAEDVVWSFDTLKAISPFYQYYYRNVTKAEITGDGEVTFTFDQANNRELPHIVGQIVVLPKHWWEGTDASGRKRDIKASTLEPPLGSGPYKVKAFSPGRSVSYERVPDYWGKDVNVNVGINNFAEIRYEYFRDATVLLEAFKADQFDYRLENSAKEWATSYDFPAVKNGRVVLESFPDQGSGLMQGFAFNLRREKFQDPRVRRAFNLAMDFEEMNKVLFYGQYQRIDSYFFGLPLAAKGAPEGRELELLNEVKAEVNGEGMPPEVFTTAYANPVGGSPEKVRANLREALGLLKAAGYEVRDGRLVNAKTGQPFTVEFLLAQENFERIVNFLRGPLERLGIKVELRVVDETQYINRVRSRDYDIITSSWGQSESPGNEQRNMWGSEAAERQGSQNYVGIKNPAIDKLIDRVIYAKDRDDLVAATKALDRVLLWNNYVIPQWSITYDRTARWDRFSRPEKIPPRGSLFPTVWWFDEAKAAKTGAGR